jgi:hypothetical protein
MPLPQDNPVPRMSDADVANVRAQTARSHEQRVERLLTVIAWLTGVIALGAIVNFIMAFMIGASVAGQF